MEIDILNLFNLIKNPFLDKIMVTMAILGNGGIIFIIIGILLFINRKTRKIGLTVLISLIFCLIFGNLLLKPLVNRIRPYDVVNYPIIVKRLRDASFPSGHTFSAFATAMSIYYYNKKWGGFIFAFAILMGISRLYLYVHYPTDVIGGIVLGFICAYLGIVISKKIEV